MDEWVDRYANDWVLFIREVHGVDPDPEQAEVLREVQNGERRISIRSGHGFGKTTTLAWAIECALLFRFPLRAVATAPTESQIFGALFNEVKVWLKRLPAQIQPLFDIRADKIMLAAAPEDSYFEARTARPEKPEALAGVHCEEGYVLLIGDEASGIHELIFEAASGSMSGTRATTILAGNPVRTSGLFYDTHHKLKSNWKTHHWDCTKSKRVSKDFISDMAQRYGEHSNAYRVRVLGEFPRGDADTIIPMELVEGAMLRDIRVHQTTQVVWGVDVAYQGTDRTVLVKRKGKVVLERPLVVRDYDEMQVVGWLKREYDATVLHDRPVDICVDAIGFGAGVAPRLRELGLPATGINVSETPALEGQYPNLRTELWFDGRKWFAGRDVMLPQRLAGRDEVMEDFIEELVSQTYEPPTSSGKVAATSKKLMKKKIGRSPDAADAFLLTFASPAGRALFGRMGGVAQDIRRNIKGIV